MEQVTATRPALIELEARCNELNDLYHSPEFRELEDEILAYWERGQQLVKRSFSLLKELESKYDSQFNPDGYLHWAICQTGGVNKVRLVYQPEIS